MKIKYLLSVIAIVAVTQNSFAQFSQDAIRFSGAQNGSTARIKALGNAGTAIGGDLSSVSGNPAGLGFFTRSELSITPELNSSKVQGSYFGQSQSTTRSTGNLNNAALVIYNQLSKPRGADKTKGWLSVNYGVGFSRTRDFYENINYGGTNNNSSIANYFSALANSSKQTDAQGTFLPNGSLESWAYNQYLIEEGGGNYTSNAQAGGMQKVSSSRDGGLNQLDFSMGANYSNKFYIGLGMSFTDIRYNASSVFGETGVANLPATSTDPAESLDYNTSYVQNQVTKGSGFNARLGVIYKPVEAVRLAASFTSPTWYTIDDLYSEGLRTRFPQSTTNSVIANENDQPYATTYNLRTPYKVSGGVAVFIKQFGFITGDIDYVDYTSAHLSSNDNYDADYKDNPDIKTLYKSAVNARIGAEARITSFFLLRGGYGIIGDAQKENGSAIKTASGGIGLRFGSAYVDATYTHASSTQTVFPYEIGTASPSALLNRTANNGYLTVGYRF
ncbi:hypothetical protein A0256_13800 [Mucilaginibacter sp. PAMC 26640]|nr:hypothetical protein A0256_13800 [Mucilaginibacter sp. PAMC 26640]